jgi:hypothetical protein
MIRKVILSLLAFGMFGMVANGVLAPDAQGAQWYPFYGYHRPSYLGGQPCVVSTQPATPQVSTAYYPPAQNTAAPSQPVSPRGYNATRWYPFYGYNRPSYLDQ